MVLCSRSYEESVNDPRNDRQERVTPRTYFLSNSLFRGRVLCVHRLSAFSRCVSLSLFLFLSSCLLFTSSSSSSFSIFSPLSFHEPFLCHRNRSYCSHRRAVAASSYPRQCHRTHVPRNRMAFSSVVWCTIRPCRFPTDRRSPIDDSDRKVGEDFVFASTVSHYFRSCVEKCQLDVQPLLGEKLRKSRKMRHKRRFVYDVLCHTQER